MSKLFIKAVLGRTVFVPGSAAQVPSEGIEVEDSIFWQRRIDDGDVLLAKAPKSQPTGSPGKDNA